MNNLKRRELDRYVIYKGKIVEVFLQGTSRYGFYQGLTKDGRELLLCPSLSEGIREGIESYVWNSEIPTTINIHFVQAIAPSTKEIIDLKIEGHYREQLKKDKPDN